MAYRGIIGNDERLRMNLLSEHEQSAKQKIVLRDSLQEQIQQKEKVKESSRIREKSEGYTSPTYHSRHHPINNPVDFKITHDNKYIINSLKS